MIENLVIPHRILASVCCLLLSLAAGCNTSVQTLLSVTSSGPGCVVPEGADRLADDVLALVNQERALRGMNPLTVNPRLAADAMAYACTMIEDEFFGHDNPETGEQFEDRHAAGRFSCHALGENLAIGHDTADLVVEDWMNSSSHRENILTDSFVQMGLGLRRDSIEGRLYWVQLFVGEHAEGCVGESDTEDPVSTAVGGLTGGLRSSPNMPTGQDDQPLTTTPTVKQESVDPNAGE